ncbi:MAG: hypothetical protein IME96_03945 [Proteobacteria bacterium]|nr:hypothetical protein [Pseudomonadota bacterium]
MKKVILIITLLLIWSDPALAGTMYVKSFKARLLSIPSFKGKTVSTVGRGGAVEQLKRKGRWALVEHNGEKGWVSRYSISKRQPMKRVSRLKKSRVKRKARRRASAFISAAAARGLTDYDRTRKGEKGFAVDFDALEVMKSIEINEDEAVTFIAEGVGR